MKFSELEPYKQQMIWCDFVQKIRDNHMSQTMEAYRDLVFDINCATRTQTFAEFTIHHGKAFKYVPASEYDPKREMDYVIHVYLIDDPDRLITEPWMPADVVANYIQDEELCAATMMVIDSVTDLRNTLDEIRHAYGYHKKNLEDEANRWRGNIDYNAEGMITEIRRVMDEETNRMLRQLKHEFEDEMSDSLITNDGDYQ